jgi:hypothetical protein
MIVSAVNSLEPNNPKPTPPLKIENMNDSECDADCGVPVSSPTYRDRWIWDGNWTFYWSAGTIISLWFCLGLGFPYLINFPHTGKNPIAFIHVIFSMVITAICVWNIFHTPSHGPTYKLLHIWLGRIALFISAIAVFFGFLSVWYLLYVPGGQLKGGGLGFGIGISIGGTAHVISVIVGFHYIRQYRMLKKMKEMYEAGNYIKETSHDPTLQEVQPSSFDNNERITCCSLSNGKPSVNNIHQLQSRSQCCEIACNVRICCEQPICGKVLIINTTTQGDQQPSSNDILIMLQQRMDTYLQIHISAMSLLFFGACLIPATMRMPMFLGGPSNLFGDSWTSYCFAFPLMFSSFHVRAFKNKSFF